MACAEIFSKVPHMIAWHGCMHGGYSLKPQMTSLTEFAELFLSPSKNVSNWKAKSTGTTLPIFMTWGWSICLGQAGCWVSWGCWLLGSESYLLIGRLMALLVAAQYPHCGRTLGRHSQTAWWAGSIAAKHAYRRQRRQRCGVTGNIVNTQEQWDAFLILHGDRQLFLIHS